MLALANTNIEVPQDLPDWHSQKQVLKFWVRGVRHAASLQIFIGCSKPIETSRKSWPEKVLSSTISSRDKLFWSVVVTFWHFGVRYSKGLTAYPANKNISETKNKIKTHSHILLIITLFFCYWKSHVSPPPVQAFGPFERLRRFCHDKNSLRNSASNTETIELQFHLKKSRPWWIETSKMCKENNQQKKNEV